MCVCRLDLIKLSPLLHNKNYMLEPPNFAHIIKHEQAILCSIFDEYHSVTIVQQSMKEEEIFEVSIHYLQHRRESKNCLSYPYHPANRFLTLARLNLIKNEQNPDQNHCPCQQTPQLKK